MTDGSMVSDLLIPVARATLIEPVQKILETERDETERIVEAFDRFVALPHEKRLAKLKVRDLAKRNPMIYTARGTTRVEDWVDGVLADKETSAMENYLGVFLEEVARIVSGGIKTGSGVDLQVDGVQGAPVQLYAIQTSPATKNSGGRRSDANALKRAAKVLRANQQAVEMNIAVLLGQTNPSKIQAEPNVAVPSSNEFWEQLTGKPDFPARLLKASIILATLIKRRSVDEVRRIKAEAAALFGDAKGNLRLDALANPPNALPKKPSASQP